MRADRGREVNLLYEENGMQGSYLKKKIFLKLREN